MSLLPVSCALTDKYAGIAIAQEAPLVCLLPGTWATVTSKKYRIPKAGEAEPRHTLGHHILVNTRGLSCSCFRRPQHLHHSSCCFVW